MQSLLANYERYLKRVAEATPASRRLDTIYKVQFPWLLGLFLLGTPVVALKLQRWEESVLMSVALLAGLGGCYAGLRVALYGWRFDRTPQPAPWLETHRGQALLKALRRVTLNRLSGLTLVTRLQEDLKLNDADLSELLSILVSEGQLDRRTLGRSGGGLTVQALLDGMSAARCLSYESEGRR